jgi:hypothetical protein
MSNIKLNASSPQSQIATKYFDIFARDPTVISLMYKCIKNKGYASTKEQSIVNNGCGGSGDALIIMQWIMAGKPLDPSNLTQEQKTKFRSLLGAPFKQSTDASSPTFSELDGYS